MLTAALIALSGCAVETAAPVLAPAEPAAQTALAAAPPAPATATVAQPSEPLIAEAETGRASTERRTPQRADTGARPAAAPAALAAATPNTTPDTEVARVAEPPPPFDPDTLIGLGRAEVATLLGNPNLLRAEPPAEVWLFKAGSCVVHLYLYGDEAMDYRVRHFEARDRGGNIIAAQGCVASLLGASPNLARRAVP